MLNIVDKNMPCVIIVVIWWEIKRVICAVFTITHHAKD